MLALLVDEVYIFCESKSDPYPKFVLFEADNNWN